MLRLAVFDLDGVLTESKSPISPEMVEALLGLPERIRLGIISGGGFPQFMQNIVPRITSPERWVMLPTNGARCYLFFKEWWEMVWDSPLTEGEVSTIIKALHEAILASGVPMPTTIYGNRTENRGTQVTFSAYGQDAPLISKKFWDTDMAKRKRIVKALTPLLPGFTITIGGTTSIDISHVSKGDGVRKAMELLGVLPTETVFIGDHLEEGGNDYAVLETRVSCFAVTSPEETLQTLPLLRYI